MIILLQNLETLVNSLSYILSRPVRVLCNFLRHIFSFDFLDLFEIVQSGNVDQILLLLRHVNESYLFHFTCKNSLRKQCFPLNFQIITRTGCKRKSFSSRIFLQTVVLCLVTLVFHIFKVFHFLNLVKKVNLLISS